VLAGAISIALTADLSAQDTRIADLAHIHGLGFDPAQPGQLLVATHHGLYSVAPTGSASQVSEIANDFMGFVAETGDAGMLLASGHPPEGGNLGLIASSDGGVSWSPVSSGAQEVADFHALAVSGANPDRIYGLFRGIQVSIDRGKSWAVASAGPSATFDLAASSVDEMTIFAATGGGLYRSDDGAESWTLHGPPSPVTMVTVGGDGTVYAFFAGVGLFSADADASNWTLLNDGLAGREFLHLAVDPKDASHLVAVTHANEVLESRDRGKSWAPYGAG
jgi:hypothetical protein